MPRYIDAEALMQKLCKQCGVKDREYFCHAYCGDRMNIDDMPTADVQSVKHGRWIIDYAEGTKIYHAHCSECNKEPARNIGGDYYIDKLSDFCPNCGARMDGDSNEKRH